MKVLIGGDMHFPHHDRKALREFTSYAAELNPDKIVLNGDVVDFYQLSPFSRKPDEAGIKKEAQMAFQFLSSLRKAFPNAEMHFNEGNHESRMEKRILERLPELYGTVMVEGLLRLDELGIIYHKSVGGESFVKLDGFYIGHYKPYGVTASRTLLNSRGVNLIQGHTHRLSLVHKRLMDRTISVIEGGCLCKTNPHYVLRPDWKQGFVTIVDGKPNIHAI